MKRLFFTLFITVILNHLSAQTEWRFDRTGFYASEKGLLKTWPADGPEMLWHLDGLGSGYTSVSIDGEQLFVTGATDGKGYLYILSMDGKIQHKVEYGPEWIKSHSGARNTVIPNDGKLYIVSGMMELFCFDRQSLKQLWKKNYVQEYGTENTLHGWHGTPLIVGEKLIIAPGGKTHNVVALNKTTGDLIWSSVGTGVMSGYGSPIYISDQQAPQVVVKMSDHIVGLDVSNGKMLWSYPHTNRFREHPNTPLYMNDMLLCTSSYDVGSVMLRLTDGGRKVAKVWEMSELGHQTGHVVKLGNYVYGAGEKMYWYCVDWQTGKLMYSDRTFGVGNIIAADGMLYVYSEKGEIALVKPNPQKFEVVSKFSVTFGTDPHWAHPVIHNGVLYVRHGDSLMAYKIK